MESPPSTSDIPSPSDGEHTSRQQKLIRDVIEAMELMLKNKASSPDPSDHVERSSETFHVDNNIQNECVWQFRSFKRSVHDLEHRFADFMREVRHLGSSSQLILSALELQKLMADILDVFRSNSAAIYTAFADSNKSSELPDILRSDSPTRDQKLPTDPKDFARLLAEISEELDNFLKSLSDIPEFSDKKLTDSIVAFESWLFYRTGSLEDFEGHSQTPAMRRYINSVMLDMSRYMTETGKALGQFAKDGVSAIKEAQVRSKEQLLNMSTVATFFSGVAATTFQYTAGEKESTLDQVVRSLWVSSLILSIASAINSQLAMHWRAAMYRSPRSALPMWTLLCLNHTPLMFLVAAVLTFSIGLVLYTYSSSQGKAVTLSATALTSFTSLILLTVIIWEGGERWQASKSRRSRRWIAGPGVPVDVHEPWEPYSDLKRFSFILGKLAFKTTRRSSLIALAPLWYLLKSLSSCFPRTAAARGDQLGGDVDEETERLPVPVLSSEKVVPDLRIHNPSNSSLETSSIKTKPRPLHRSPTPSGIAPLRVRTEKPPEGTEESPPPTPGGRRADSRARRLSNSVRRLIDDPASRDLIKSLPMSPYEPKTLRTVNPVARLTPDRGSGAIHDLTFSPDGKWLAASFANDTTGVWALGADFAWYNSFPTQPGSLKWSPDSGYLLARQKERVVVWSPKVCTPNSKVLNDEQDIRPPAELRQSHSRKKFEAVTWLSDGKHYAAVHEQHIYIIAGDTGETQRDRCISSHPLRLHDIASIPTGTVQGRRRSLIIAVGSVRDESWNDQIYQNVLSLKFLGAPWQVTPARPEEVKPQRRISVYDTETRRICAVVPVWGEARHVAVSRSGKFALISYAGSTPPELWQINISAQGIVSLELSHMYLPATGNAESNTSTTEFVGQARFGGDSDEYIVAATIKGEVYIWETQSSQICHVIKDARDGALNNQVTGIGWCPTNEERRVPMFGCGLDNAEIVIWKGKSQDIRAESANVTADIENKSPQAGLNNVDATRDETTVQEPVRK